MDDGFTSLPNNALKSSLERNESNLVSLRI
jgi:hypothetical protein